MSRKTPVQVDPPGCAGWTETIEPGWTEPFEVTSGEIDLYRNDDETVDLAFYHWDAHPDTPTDVISGLSREDLTRLGSKLIRHGRLADVPVPLTWRDGEPLTPEERVRIGLLRILGCTCRLPLLGYTGGNLTDGPRCRLCNTGINFTTEES